MRIFMSGMNIGPILNCGILSTHSPGIKIRTRRSAGNGINGPVGKTYEEGVDMKGCVQDIEGLTVKNDEFRRVLYTTKNCQLVVMALKPKEENGAKVQMLDQFFRMEEGVGEQFLMAFGHRSVPASRSTPPASSVAALLEDDRSQDTEEQGT